MTFISKITVATLKTDISRFANMTPEGGLVGAPVYARRNIYQARRASARPAPITAAPKITPISVRTSRSPEYPSRARRRGAQAVITLALDIDKRGRVVQTHVFEVSADDYEKDFIRAAKRAAQRSRFNPKRINGKAVPQDGYVRTYAFKL